MHRDSQHEGLVLAEDSILAGRAADGDTAAFAVLVRRYTPMMRAYARQILPGTAEIDDVLQDVFITAWERLPELVDPARVKSWLMRITGRKAVDRARARREHVNIEDVDPVATGDGAPAQTVQARAGAEALRAALHELPGPQRETWVLREIGEYSYEEIAAELELPMSTVRGLLARARKFLMVRMEEWK